MKLHSSIKVVVVLSLLYAGTSYANPFSNLGQTNGDVVTCPHWYVGANLGVSHLFDKSTPGFPSSVDENGPSGSVDVGYQFTRFFGVEAGYTQYYNSRENIGVVNIAKTVHFSSDLVATGQYPLYKNISVLGKLGAAYSYAYKTYYASGISGISASSGSLAPYAGLGFVFKITRSVDFIVQAARAWGNDYTGSADLYSVGVQAAIL